MCFHVKNASRLPCMPLEQDPKQANSCTNKCHQTLKGKQIDHKSAPFVNDKIAKKSSFDRARWAPCRDKAGTRSGQEGTNQKVTQNARFWGSPGSPKGHFCGQFPFLLGSRGICENSGFVYTKHQFWRVGGTPGGRHFGYFPKRRSAEAFRS